MYWTYFWDCKLQQYIMMHSKFKRRFAPPVQWIDHTFNLLLNCKHISNFFVIVYLKRNLLMMLNEDLFVRWALQKVIFKKFPAAKSRPCEKNKFWLKWLHKLDFLTNFVRRTKAFWWIFFSFQLATTKVRVLFVSRFSITSGTWIYIVRCFK